jgi:hypothetical protein
MEYCVGHVDPRYNFPLPLPETIKHTDLRPLKHIGSPCPYCRGTTSFHPTEKLVICLSCDFSWDFQKRPLGIIKNVGVIR